MDQKSKKILKKTLDFLKKYIIFNGSYSKLTRRDKCVFSRVATIAQLVEHLTCNEMVAGSIPAGGSFYGKVPEWPKGTDCKSVGSAFGGSNPPLPTKVL